MAMITKTTRGRETIPGEGIEQEPSPVHANLLQSPHFDAVLGRQETSSEYFSGGKTVKALLDTGSAVTLCNSDLLKQLKEHSTRQRKKNLDLRAATGAPLCIRDIRKAEVHLNGHHTPTEIIFVDNLQVQCCLLYTSPSPRD